jgi:hypothetical protein
LIDLSHPRMQVNYGDKTISIDPNLMIETCLKEYKEFVSHMVQSEGLPLEKG